MGCLNADFGPLHLARSFFPTDFSQRKMERGMVGRPSRHADACLSRLGNHFERRGALRSCVTPPTGSSDKLPPPRFLTVPAGQARNVNAAPNLPAGRPAHKRTSAIHGPKPSWK